MADLPAWVNGDVEMAQSLVGRTIVEVGSPADSHGLRHVHLVLDDGRNIRFLAEGYEADGVGIYDDRGISDPA